MYWMTCKIKKYPHAPYLIVPCLSWLFPICWCLLHAGEGIIFLGCQSAIFIHPDIFCSTICHERLEQSWWNLMGVLTG